MPGAQTQGSSGLIHINGDHKMTHSYISCYMHCVFTTKGRMKGISSKWLNDTFSDSPLFRWQEGYGAFSVGIKQINRTVSYIDNQKEHHLNQTFDEELRAFLGAHGMKQHTRG